jgi:cytochrome c553
VLWLVARALAVKTPAALLLACLAVLPVVATSQSTPAVLLPDPIAAGQRIYREGILPSGESLRGAGQAGVVLSGKAAACATCHRRSGYGSSEGPIEVKAITGPALFGEQQLVAVARRQPRVRAPRHCGPSVPPGSKARGRGRSMMRRRWRGPSAPASMSAAASWMRPCRASRWTMRRWPR